MAETPSHTWQGSMSTRLSVSTELFERARTGRLDDADRAALHRALRLGGMSDLSAARIITALASVQNTDNYSRPR